VNRLALLAVLAAVAAPLAAATYHVAGSAADASDDNPGTAAAPWKSIARAAAADELAPGDTVLIAAGVYRESVEIEVCGEPGRPITFAAEPDARVVVKGSELVRGEWTKLTDDPKATEPYPNAFANVWKIQLGDEFFADPRFEACYRDKSRRWVSQVFVQDSLPLQRIGPSRIYKNDEYHKLATVGRGLGDIIQNSFYFDPADQTLYIKIAGSPSWYSIEVGVRGFVLHARQVHDVVIRGIEIRHNRQPGGQWPMACISKCERVLLDRCSIHQADFCGLGIGQCRHCTVRRCDLSHNGCNGLGMSKNEHCMVEHSTLLWNNYRRFHPGWAAGGMKCIPGNRRCTIRRCEAAYNTNAAGIWFDADNADIRILANVSHHNDGCGIFFEINKGGGLIADNLVYANRGRGIYISGSQKTWIVHNTVACNGAGIVAMPRGPDWPLADVHILNNLLIRNTIATTGHARGCDLTLYMGTPAEYDYTRTVVGNRSDHNVYANTSWTPNLRHTWNPDNTLEQWRERFGEDLHSVQMPVRFEQWGAGFRLLSTRGLRIAAPLPSALGWRSPTAARRGLRRLLPWRRPRPPVGSSITRWPSW